MKCFHVVFMELCFYSKNMTLTETRNELLKTRQALTSDYIKEKSLRMTEDILSDERFRKANVIYVYWPINNEIDTEYIIVEALRQKKSVALPIVLSSGDMVFGRIDGNPGFKKSSRFHIMEPKYDPRIVIDKPGLMLVPIVGFTGKTRIGYGKQFYNNYLSNRQDTLYTIGVAYDFQKVEGIEPDARDVELNEIRSY